MVFSIFIILFIGIITFFHYVQGFFSATISAMITVLAAVLAVSYDEPVVNLLLKGKMADQAHAMVLCMIFAVVYIVLRVIFDAAIPGNVRTPSTVDKAGSILMGLVSGIFCTGIFAIAVQMLPFDATISWMGAPRYVTEDTRKMILPTSGASLDRQISEELTGNVLNPDPKNPLAVPAIAKGLLIPVDDLVLNTVYHLSDGGSLAGDKTLASVHPDYLQELFGERLGIQDGAQHLTLNLNGNQSIDIQGLFTTGSLPCFDGQLKEVRSSTYKPLYKMEKLPKLDPNSKDQIESGVVKPSPDERILVVRFKVKAGATSDPDNVYRFSPGSIHLVGKDSTGAFKDFYPIGTLENGSAVLLNKPDDYLFVKEDKMVDAVFVVDANLLSGQKPIKMSPGTSITIKRFSDFDLSGETVQDGLTSNADVQVMRPKVLADRLKPYLPPAAPEVASGAAAAPAGSPSTPAAAGDTSPAAPAGPQPVPGKEVAQDISASTGNTLQVTGLNAIATTSSDDNAKDAPVPGGKISVKGGKISVATIDPTATLQQLNAADTSYTQFYCPSNRVMVQVTIHPYANNWNWINELSSTNVVDSNGVTYPPLGFYVKVSNAGSTGLLLRYDASQTPAVTQPDGTPASDLTYIFQIPSDTTLKSFTAGGKTQNLSSPLHVP
jgi:uncharacterized membrane protein required for colicin V production